MKKENPYHNESMFKGAPASSFAKAENLRNNLTVAEDLLWQALKGNKVNGLKFRRQHPVHLYIADFYCHKLKLVIEIDGTYHNSKNQKLLDLNRTNDLESQGIKVIRFSNQEVENNLKEVIEKIKEISKELISNIN